MQCIAAFSSCDQPYCPMPIHTRHTNQLTHVNGVNGSVEQSNRKHEKMMYVRMFVVVVSFAQLPFSFWTMCSRGLFFQPECFVQCTLLLYCFILWLVHFNVLYIFVVACVCGVMMVIELSNDTTAKLDALLWKRMAMRNNATLWVHTIMAQQCIKPFARFPLFIFHQTKPKITRNKK